MTPLDTKSVYKKYSYHKDGHHLEGNIWQDPFFV
jgi:hypothetical protein